MRTLKKISVALILTVGMIFTFQSCQKDFENDTNNSNINETSKIIYENIPWNDKGKTLEKIGIGLSKALEHEEFRILIKNEALNKFNGDYDVLYQQIKNTNINPMVLKGKNGKDVSINNLHDFLIQFFSSEAELIAYENKIPTLTIFVPTLPENSFSAETWDANNQIPDIALRLDNISYVPVIGKDDTFYLIEPDLVPSYPIVVLKENERVVSNQDPLYQKLDTEIIETDSEFSYKYLDINFYPPHDVPLTSFEGVTDANIPQSLISSYNIWQNQPNGGWQRDYIYYNLTPAVTTGVFNYGKYREHLTTFKLKENPQIAYNTVSNSFNETLSDPQLTGWQQNFGTAWTDGYYEFQVKLYYGAISGNVGEYLSKGFSANPDELFDIAWEQYILPYPSWAHFTFYKPHVIGVKTLNTAIPERRVEFSTWDLSDFANRWLYKFEEVDASVTINESSSVAHKYNANIGIDVNTGNKIKLGLKFGASTETTNSSSYSTSRLEGSDDLGSLELPFYDQIVYKSGSNYYLRRYFTDKLEVSFAPVQVEF